MSISITESISSRLKSALVINETLDTNTPKPVAVDEHSEISKIVTTEEELEAFQIVKAILRERSRQKELPTETPSLILVFYWMITTENQFVVFILEHPESK